MDLGLVGKKALVLGASRGIGRGVAARLAAEGADVAICARNAERLEDTAKAIGAAQARCCDLAEHGAAATLAADLLSEWGRIDILVCNTGGPERGPFMQTAAEDWRSGFQSLWMSVVDASQAVLPAMQAAGWGRVVLMTSNTGKEPQAGLAIASSLRSGLHGLTRVLSSEVAPHGITVNAVLPGFVRTEALLETGFPVEKAAAMIPARRLAEPEEIGDLVCFLTSPRADYITGQLIGCDGGVMRGL